MYCEIRLKFQFWIFENGRTNKGKVNNFSGPLPGPRGYMLKEQFSKIADLKKIAQ